MILGEPFKKFDAGKPRLDLVPREAIEAMARAFSIGVEKYGEGNWRSCTDKGRIAAAALRHLYAWNSGELVDPDSGLSHLDHAITNLAILIGCFDRG